MDGSSADLRRSSRLRTQTEHGAIYEIQMLEDRIKKLDRAVQRTALTLSNATSARECQEANVKLGKFISEVAEITARLRDRDDAGDLLDIAK